MEKEGIKNEGPHAEARRGRREKTFRGSAPPRARLSSSPLNALNTRWFSPIRISRSPPYLHIPFQRTC